ncbi:hypothetical protein EBU99_00005, partial [bacterium]|nr:hypothetical protein [bacterium]
MSNYETSSKREAIVEALSSIDMLALLIPRVRIQLSSTKDKKKALQIQETLFSLEKLERALRYAELVGGQSKTAVDDVFVDGLPRCSFQVESQFEHYVNPPSNFNTHLRGMRILEWEVIERTLPWTVREMLISWRWDAESQVFQDILVALRASQKKVSAVERTLKDYEESELKKSRSESWSDKLRMLVFAKSSRRDEARIIALEKKRDECLAAVSECLYECEQIALRIAIAMRSLLVDCGEQYSR